MSIVEVVLGSLDEYPLLLTVEEAAGVLRISRSLAYDLARQYEATDGRSGLPVMRLGTCMRAALGAGGADRHRPCRAPGGHDRELSGLIVASETGAGDHRRLVVGAGAIEVRRRVGPLAWCALETLAVTATGTGLGGEVFVEASVRSVAAELSVAPNTVQRAGRVA